MSTQLASGNYNGGKPGVATTLTCRPDIDPPVTWLDLLWHMANGGWRGPARGPARRIRTLEGLE